MTQDHLFLYYIYKLYDIYIFCIRYVITTMNRHKKHTQNQQLFYNVEKIIKIIEEKNKKYAIVKWIKFATPTKESLEHIKTNLQLAKEIERLQFQFEDSKKGNYSLKNLTIDYFEEYKALYFKDSPQNTMKEESIRKETKNSIYEKALCKKEAKKMIIDRIRYGLKDLNAKDYYELIKTKHDMQEYLSDRMIDQEVIDFHSQLLDVKGIIKTNETYQFTIALNEKMYTCSFQEMKEHFPLTLVNWITNLTDYMMKYMQRQIRMQGEAIKKRRYRENGVKHIKQIINIKERLYQKENPVYFGYDMVDIQNNMKEEENKLNDSNLNELDRNKEIAEKLNNEPNYFLKQINSLIISQRINESTPQKSSESSRRRSSRINSSNSKSNLFDQQQQDSQFNNFPQNKTKSLSKSSKISKKSPKKNTNNKTSKKNKNRKQTKKKKSIRMSEQNQSELSSEGEDYNMKPETQQKSQEQQKEESQKNSLKSRLRRYSSNNSDQSGDLGGQPVKQVKF